MRHGWTFLTKRILKYKKNPENFGSSLIGITEADFRALNQELEMSVDETAFKGRNLYFISERFI